MSVIAFYTNCKDQTGNTLSVLELVDGVTVAVKIK